MKRTIVGTLCLALALGLASQAGAGGSLPEKKVLTLAAAKMVAAAAESEAKRLGAGGAIAVVDDGGQVIVVERIDGTFPAGASVSVDKARTAAQFRRPTRDFESAIKNGRVALTGVPQMLPLQGGVPILVDGQVVGAVGVSGAMSAQQDDDIATLAAKAGEAFIRSGAAMAVTFLDKNTVDAGFAKGAVLVNNGTYMVHASRREAPGQAEVHALDTDLIYVLEGKATFVTGGSVVDGKETAPNELRGASIAGGETRTLAKGDFVLVPNGTPHWFKDVAGPLLYYVVKVQ